MSVHPRGTDVIGLNKGNHGQECKQHQVCGYFVKEGDKLYCTCSEDNYGRGIENSVSVYKVGSDGHALCHVGYLPR